MPAKKVPFALWLSWQELSSRKAVFLINVIIVALLIALPVSLDLMGNAKKSSIDTRVDYIGPSLILAPDGIISSDITTAQFKGKSFSSSIFKTVREKHSSYLRNAEARLTERLPVKGREMPVVGIDFSSVYSYPFRNYDVSDNEALLGNVAAEKLKKEKGDNLVINSGTFMIADIIPTSGDIGDASVFLTLSALQKLSAKDFAINEIRLFPESALSYEELKSRLAADSYGLQVIDTYRGETAEEGIDTTLLNYQKALYTVAFILIAICIMISTYINLDERRAEVSTVYTLGAAQGIILQALTLRTVWITLLGSLAGQMAALIITVIQTDQVPVRMIWDTASFFEVLAGTVLLGILVTIPFALYSVYKKDLIEYL